MASPAVLPFVSYSSMTEASCRRAMGSVYASLQTLKAHVQEYPGCQRFDVFIRAEENGDVLLHCYTTWDTPGSSRRSSSAATRLSACSPTSAALGAERSLVMEKVF